MEWCSCLFAENAITESCQCGSAEAAHPCSITITPTISNCLANGPPASSQSLVTPPGSSNSDIQAPSTVCNVTAIAEAISNTLSREYSTGKLQNTSWGSSDSLKIANGAASTEELGSISPCPLPRTGAPHTELSHFHLHQTAFDPRCPVCSEGDKIMTFRTKREFNHHIYKSLSHRARTRLLPPEPQVILLGATLTPELLPLSDQLNMDHQGRYFRISSASEDIVLPNLKPRQIETLWNQGALQTCATDTMEQRGASARAAIQERYRVTRRREEQRGAFPPLESLPSFQPRICEQPRKRMTKEEAKLTQTAIQTYIYATPLERLYLNGTVIPAELEPEPNEPEAGRTSTDRNMTQEEADGRHEDEGHVYEEDEFVEPDIFGERGDLLSRPRKWRLAPGQDRDARIARNEAWMLEQMK